MDLTVGLLDIS